MARFVRDGLIEALTDFGIDLAAAGGFDFGLDVAGSVQLQDLSLNFMPAVRCRAFAQSQVGILGGNYSGLSVQSPSTGMWVREALNGSAGDAALWISLAPWVTLGTGSLIAWDAFGDESGQVRTGSLDLADFLGAARGVEGHSAVSPPPSRAGFGVPIGQLAAVVPLWVPPLAFFNFVNVVIATASNLSVGIQFAAQNPGRLP